MQLDDSLHMYEQSASHQGQALFEPFDLSGAGCVTLTFEVSQTRAVAAR